MLPGQLPLDLDTYRVLLRTPYRVHSTARQRREAEGLMKERQSRDREGGAGAVARTAAVMLVVKMRQNRPPVLGLSLLVSFRPVSFLLSDECLACLVSHLSCPVLS